jgi:hypothetical protein
LTEERLKSRVKWLVGPSERELPLYLATEGADRLARPAGGPSTTRRWAMKRVFITCALVVGLGVAGATSAQAGETKGTGEPIERGGTPASACSFSGRDLPDAQENQPNIPDDFVTNGHVQSYGMYVRAGLKDNPMLPSPGIACRGHAELEG